MGQTLMASALVGERDALVEQSVGGGPEGKYPDTEEDDKRTTPSYPAASKIHVRRKSMKVVAV